MANLSNDRNGAPKTQDINAKRGVIVVKYAKGGTERLVPLSQTLLGQLREYWKSEQPTALYLFPSTVSAAPICADVPDTSPSPSPACVSLERSAQS